MIFMINSKMQEPNARYISPLGIYIIPNKLKTPSTKHVFGRLGLLKSPIGLFQSGSDFRRKLLREVIFYHPFGIYLVLGILVLGISVFINDLSPRA